MAHHASHKEGHLVTRIGWLRAAVLGANDGVVSTSSLILGVAAGAAKPGDILLAGVAALAAGALSMSAGEYVSVSSQSDTERASLAQEREEIKANATYEREELAGIYVRRGLDHDLAAQVADQLMAKNALEAHARDELGISEVSKPRPLQAAAASALAFTTGAAIPLILVIVSPVADTIPAVSVGSLIFLAALGVFGARAGGAKPWRAALRVTVWGAIAMGVTAAIGAALGTAV